VRALLVIAAAVVTTFSVGIQPAGAGPPRDGGRYAGIDDQGAVKVRVKLTLANDGDEFAWPSFVELRSKRGCVTGWGLASSWFKAHAKPVEPGGRFSTGPVRGRFTRGGTMAVGTVAAKAGCTTRALRFSAPLRGTPRAAVRGMASRCDRITIRAYRDEAYELSEHRIGCTRARAIGRELDRQPGCSALERDGTSCAFGTATCERVRGGLWLPRASIRCTDSTRPGSAVELVHHRSCAEPEIENEIISIRLSSINIECKAARLFPFGEALSRRSGVACGPPAPGRFERCTAAAGFVCRTRTVGSTTGGVNSIVGCHDIADPFRALRFIWLVPP